MRAKPPSRNRPDIVVLPDSSLGAYAADCFDTSSEIIGLRSVAIVELKKGGFPLTMKEVRQAEDYVAEIRKTNLVQPATKILAYVLGATIDDAEERALGAEHRRVIPMTYDLVLQKAHARTFHLKKKLEALEVPKLDVEVEEALASPIQDEIDYAERNGTTPVK